jgi:hypothetical protein
VTGTSCLDLEHFNPTLTGKARHRYDNLMVGTHLSNMAKRKIWPSLSDRRKGIRFLNPCKEQDYGTHLFEDPISHRIVSSTPAGRFHIVACNLNDETYVWYRPEENSSLAAKKRPKSEPGSTHLDNSPLFFQLGLLKDWPRIRKVGMAPARCFGKKLITPIPGMGRVACR